MLDEDVLREEGVTDFRRYRHDRESELELDIFVESGGHPVD